MPIITVKLRTAVRRTFRVEQVAGMFDVPLGKVEGRRSKVEGHDNATIFDLGLSTLDCVRHELTAEVPGVDEKWTIGAIVGPSGSGKTTLAKAAFGQIYKPRAWPKDRAIIDALGEEGERGARNSERGAAQNAECRVRNAELRENGTRSVPTTYSIKDLTRVLAAVGLGSPPTWLKPYHVLSGGEKFRADLVRAVLAQSPVLVIDEFTSSLDRTVAKTTSAALGRLLRGQGTGTRRQETAENGQAPGLSPVACLLPPLRLVAVTCHRDVLPWLGPDWVVELGVRERATSPRKTRQGDKESGRQGDSTTNAFSPCPLVPVSPSPSVTARLIRARPRRPSFRFTVERAPQALWTRFSGEHYLSGGLAASASCYAAFIGQVESRTSKVESRDYQTTFDLGLSTFDSPGPIGFCAVVACLGWKQTKRIQRLVVLPEFQGMGIGGKLLDIVAADQAAKGFRVTITASHPAVLAHCGRSERWRYLEIKKLGSTRQVMDGREIASSEGRAVAAFEYVEGRRSKVESPRSN